MLLVSLGVCLTLAGNIISYSFHAYQTELFPTSIRARAVGFVYSWSRFSAIFTSFIIAGVLKEFGTTGVFVFIAGRDADRDAGDRADGTEDARPCAGKDFALVVRAGRSASQRTHKGVLKFMRRIGYQS